MGKNTKIIASVAPLAFNTNYLTVVVNFTPRLPDSGLLSEYDEILRWPDFAQFFKEKDVQFKFFPENNLGHGISLSAKRSSSRDPDAVQLWHSMFTETTPVSGWLINESAYHLVDAITHSEIKKQIILGINRCIEKLLVFPSVEDTENPFAFYGHEDLRRKQISSLVGYLETLKLKEITAILNDPILFHNEFRNILRHLYDSLETIDADSKKQFKDLLVQLAVEDIEKKNYEQTAEFHKRMSAYSNHPQLMIKTGWMVEYQIEITQEFLKKGRKGFIKIDNTEGFLSDPMNSEDFKFFTQSVEFLFPITQIQAYDQNTVVSGKYDTSKEKSLLNIDEKTGYIRINNESHYHIQANLVDKQQVLGRIESILTSDYNNGTSAKDDPVTQKNKSAILQSETTELINQIGLGSSGSEYVSSGISVDIHNLKEIIRANLILNPEDNQTPKKDSLQNLEGNGVIFQHNLIAGYRVDVISVNAINDERSFGKGSLCRKEEYYYLKDENKLIYSVPDEEGIIFESTQGSNSGKLYVDEELFRWNDWSLVASQLGDHEEGLDRTGCNPDLQICILPGTKNMVPLRFGRKYSFALRTTDITGHSQKSVDLITDVFNDTELHDYISGQVRPSRLDDFWTHPILYQRVESVNSPVLFLGNTILERGMTLNTNVGEDSNQINEINTPDWLPHRWGEDIQTLVLRSYYEGENSLVFDKRSTTCRYIAPPKANWNFVVQHGTLDSFFRQIEIDFHPLQGSRNDQLSEDQLKKLEVIKSEFLNAADSKIDPDIHQVINGGFLSYMWDPVVEGYEFVIDHIVRRISMPSQDSVEDYHQFKYWEHGKYLLLTLKELDISNSEEYVFGSGSDPFTMIDFFLKQGNQKTISLSCTLVAKNQESIDTKLLFLPGIPKVRRANLNLIHAVQKPCLLKARYDNNATGRDNFRDVIFSPDFNFFDRLPGQSLAKFKAGFEKFPVLTSDSFFLHIEYFNWIGDRTASEGYRIEPVFTIGGGNFLPDLADSEENVKFSQLQYVFSDTTFRMAQFRIEAVSKFKKYFSPKLMKNGFSVFGTHHEGVVDTFYFSPDDLNPKIKWNKDNYTHSVTTWKKVFSTKQPAPPKILKTTPIIRWVQNDDRLISICDTIRIYFDCDWYSSGPGEQVAIFFVDSPDFNSANVLDLKDNPEISLENAISQFGKDPAATIIDLVNWKNMFVLKEGSFDTVQINYCKLMSGTVPLSNLEFERPRTNIIQNLDIQVMLYDIQFTRENGEGQYYVDICIKNELIKDFYMPFVRFAVARYQENSIKNIVPDCRFSKIVLSDFVQFLPYRELVIKGKNLTYNALSLRKIEDSAANYKVENKLYLLSEKQENLPFELFDITSDDLASGLPVQQKMDLNIPSNDESYQLAEYEFYQNPGELDPYKFEPNENDPRKNYRRRKVFSYLIRAKSK